MPRSGEDATVDGRDNGKKTALTKGGICPSRSRPTQSTQESNKYLSCLMSSARDISAPAADMVDGNPECCRL